MTTKKKKKIGRPKRIFSKEELKSVEEMAGRGVSDENIAKTLSINPDTLYDKIKTDQEFSESIKRGRAKGEDFAANCLNVQMQNGNITAIIFYLKTRHNWKETSVQEHKGDGLPFIVLPTEKDVTRWENTAQK